MMNIFRRLQGNGFSFTVFSTWDWNHGLDSELKRLGIGRWTVFCDEKPDQLTRLRTSPRLFAELAMHQSVDAVYINTMNGMGFMWADAARRAGIPTRVVHSHNSAFGAGNAVVKTIAHNYGKAVLGGSATSRLAVSKEAGRYLFGNRDFEVVSNGIDTNHFAFNSDARLSVREKYGIPRDAIVFGSIGRLSEAKNPQFQLRTFAEILKREPNAYYVMVGDGDLREQCNSIVEQLGLSDRVLMLGYMYDPSDVYSALDCLLMPSLYEGLAMVCVEAQCAGCPIVCSEALPLESQLTDMERRIPLASGEVVWASEAITAAKATHNRMAYREMVAAAGFSADATAKKLAKVFDD